MKTRQLGRHGPTVSALGLGCMVAAAGTTAPAVAPAARWPGPVII